MSNWCRDFRSVVPMAREWLQEWGEDIDPGHWQGVSTEGRLDLLTRELVGFSFNCPMPGAAWDENGISDLETLKLQIEPNLPWADNHFEERVSRVPSNPGNQYKNWPWWRGQSDQSMVQNPHLSDEAAAHILFTHTYQERFWPKDAWLDAHGGEYPTLARTQDMGIRYDYGDLDDVVSLLFRKPMTRQAYLPIFFPEDTGAVHGGRIPCTLGYYFLLRNMKLHMWYTIRSCDFIRHFRDDIYLATRLLLWVIQELVDKELRSDKAPLWVDVAPGNFNFQAFSLHYHKGDEHLIYQGGEV